MKEAEGETVHASQAVIDRSSSGALEKLPVSQQPRFSRKLLTSNWTMGLLVGAVDLGLGLYHIDTPSLWFDELLSVERASQPLPVLWNIVNASQPNMALYYFFLHFWLQFTALLGFHPTATVVRFPSAIFAAGAAVVLFLLIRRLFGLIAGITGATLYIFNTMQLIYTQDTRAYALQLLLLMLGWYALLAVLHSDRSQRRWLICYVVSMVLAVYTHYFSLLLLFAQGVALVALLLLPTPWRARTRSLFRPLFFSLLSTTIIILPMLYASRVGAQTGWIPVPEPRDVVNLFKEFSNKNKAYLLTFATLTILGALVGILVSFTGGRQILKRLSWPEKADEKQIARARLLAPFGLIVLCWLSVPIVVSYILTHLSLHVFLDRYLVTVVPAFCLLAVFGLMAIRWRRIRAVVALCLVLFAMVFIPQYYASAQVQEWNTGAFWVEHHYQAGDGLVCFDDLKGCQVGMEYYFNAYPTQAHFDADSPGSFSYVQYDLQRPAYQPDVTPAIDPVALQKYAAEHPRLFYIVANLSNQTQVAQAESAIAWLDSQYQRVDSIKAGTVDVYLYNTTPHNGAGH